MAEYAIFTKSIPTGREGAPRIVWHLFEVRERDVNELVQTLCEDLLVEIEDDAIPVPFRHWATSPWRCPKCDARLSSA